MARIVKDRAVRQGELLDAAQQLFVERGYRQTSVQAIIDHVGIAKGTFYHHYRSKADLLDALVMRLLDQSLALVQPLVDDPGLGAIDKFVGIFQRIGHWKAEHREFMLDVTRALSADAELQRHLTREGQLALEPVLARVIEQGVGEGVFDIRHSAQAGRIILRIGQSLSEAIAEILLRGERRAEASAQVEDHIEAHCDAMERVLGAPPGCVRNAYREQIPPWFEGNGSS